MILEIVAVAVAAAAEPLPVPANFDPEVNMPAHTTVTGRYHSTRSAAGLAARLVANGTPQDLALAEKVLEAVLECQERRKERRTYGNFTWMREDNRVQDPNAVEFVLGQLIPMMIHHGDRLSPETRALVTEGIRLGLEEIRSIDVTLAYTNMAIYDVRNSCLGGELLGDTALARRGYEKLRAWEAFTGANGTVGEYNSPTYGRVTMGALDALADDVRDEDTRIRARALAARLALSVALRIHRGTGRWAGPHSRAYHPTVVCQGGPEVGSVEGWIDGGAAPGWIRRVLDGPELPFQVTETASVTQESALTTYHAPSFAMGTATRTYGPQADVFMVHYNRPVARRPGVLYSRYLTNDKWLGDTYHQSDRSFSRNLGEEGQFFGVQSGPRAIGLYRPPNAAACTSAKAALIWTQREHVDEIWVGGRRIEDIPATVAPGEVVVVGSGEALLAVRPLTLTDLGRGASVRLVDVGGDLVLELPNYRGPAMRLRTRDAQAQCGFYVEAAARAAYPDGRAFGDAVAVGKLKDKAAKPRPRKPGKERPWTVAYSRDGQTLGIEVDLAGWRLKRRWNDDGPLGCPMLESPAARQTGSGEVAVGGAVLRCGEHPAWLFADPDSRTWAAGYHGPPAPLMLTVPGGEVRLGAMGSGTVVWEDGAVTVEAVGLEGAPRVEGGQLAP